MKKVYITRNNLFKNIPMILCNKITEIDPGFIEDNFDLFETPCEDCEGTGEVKGDTCDGCYGEGRFDSEVYQYFISSMNEWTKANLQSFGVEVGYSNLLDTEIIPIYDFGTSWSCFSYSKEVPDGYQLAHNETLERTTVY